MRVCDYARDGPKDRGVGSVEERQGCQKGIDDGEMEREEELIAAPIHPPKDGQQGKYCEDVVCPEGTQIGW